MPIILQYEMGNILEERWYLVCIGGRGGNQIIVTEGGEQSCMCVYVKINSSNVWFINTVKL